MPDPERLRHRAAGVEPLAGRLKLYQPQAVIVVMKAIVPEGGRACEIAGINPRRLALPFSSRPRHQEAFVQGLVQFLRSPQ